MTTCPHCGARNEDAQEFVGLCWLCQNTLVSTTSLYTNTNNQPARLKEDAPIPVGTERITFKRQHLSDETVKHIAGVLLFILLFPLSLVVVGIYWMFRCFAPLTGIDKKGLAKP